MLPRPRLRLPLWAAAAIVAAAYLIRSILRGMDFRLEWPADAVALGLFAAIVVMVAYVRNVIALGDEVDQAPQDDDEGPPAP
jgi:hypothetical protein